MMKVKSSFVKKTLLYTAVDGLGKGLNFLLIPYLSFYLLPEDLGIVSNYNVFLTIVNLLTISVFVNAISYNFYNKTFIERKRYISSVIFVCLILSFIVSILVLIFSNLIFEQFLLIFFFQKLLIIQVLIGSYGAIISIIYRLEHNTYKFSIFQIGQIFLNFGLVILLVVILNMGAEGRVLGIVITSVCFSFISLFSLFRKGYIGRPNLIEIKSIFRFSLPLLPHSLSFWLKSGADKLLITAYCGLAFNGLYSLAISITSMYVMFITSFNNAFIPDVQQKLESMDLNNEDSILIKKGIVKNIYLFALAFIFLFLVTLFICVFFFNHFIDSKYSEALPLLGWLLLAQLFNAFYGLVVQFIYKVKKTVGLGILTFSGSILQVLLAFFLIKDYGFIGAAYSSVVGSIIIFIGIFYYSNRVYPMPWFEIFKSNYVK